MYFYYKKISAGMHYDKSSETKHCKAYFTFRKGNRIVLQFISAKTFPKKSFLLKEGEVCKFEGFVIKGLFRVFHIDKNGFEQILYFAVENWWVTDIDSFTNGISSQLFIEALEDSEVLIISKKDKEFAYENLPEQCFWNHV